MITKIWMKNFRRFRNQKIEFDRGLSYIEGRNNAGKTTIFLAIEYGLFGTVGGFRSQTALFHPNTKEMGVQVIYQGKDGKTYKLQRMHELKGRSATGHYTLKKIVEGNEKYIISSDFEKASEEKLQLEIFETLGISKRLFDVALNIKQGDITSILEGEKLLDIVLGVSAAVLAQKQLNSVALGFEKETSQYPILEQTLKGYENELLELQKQERNLDHDLEKLTKEITNLTDKIEGFQTNKNQLEPVLSCYNDFNSICMHWDKIFDKLKDQNNRVNNLIEEYGNLTQIETQIQQIQSQLKENEQEIESKEKDLEQLQGTLRKNDQKMGDLRGKISRRQNLPKGEATCEECGAPIDQDRVKQELELWTSEMIVLQNKVEEINTGISTLNLELKTIQNEIRELTAKLSTLKGKQNQMNTSKSELQELKLELEKQNENLLDGAVDLYETLQEYNKQKPDEGKINIPKPQLLDLDISFNIDDDVITARSMNTVYSEKLDAEREKLREKLNEVQVEKRVLDGQLKDKESQKSNLKPRIETVNQEIANTKSNLKSLEKKRVAAEKMRTGSSIFKSLQSKLRDRASGNLAEKTLHYHDQLSDSKEYSNLTVDPKNYRIYVQPEDIGEEVPAHSYQGGGHKLLLGLSFKLAIIHLVTNPPFILLDEPTYGLDTTHKGRLFEKIGELTKTQLLLITHQRAEKPTSAKLFQVIKDENESKIEELS